MLGFVSNSIISKDQAVNIYLINRKMEEKQGSHMVNVNCARLEVDFISHCTSDCLKGLNTSIVLPSASCWTNSIQR